MTRCVIWTLTLLVSVAICGCAQNAPARKHANRAASHAPMRSVGPSQRPSAQPTTASTPIAVASATNVRPVVLTAPLRVRPLHVQWSTVNGAFAPLVPATPKLDRTPAVPMLPPNAPPEIVALQLPGTSVSGGETVNGSVVASSNVASVQIKIATFSKVMKKVAPGRFEISVVVPHTPFFLHRTYTLQVIARNTHGDAVTQSLPINVR